MVKKLYEAAWILSLIGGILCILFAVLNGICQTAAILLGKSIFKGLTDIANAAILGVLGFFIIGAARITRAGGQKAITGGIFLFNLWDSGVFSRRWNRRRHNGVNLHFGHRRQIHLVAFKFACYLSDSKENPANNIITAPSNLPHLRHTRHL